LFLLFVYCFHCIILYYLETNIRFYYNITLFVY
jgi:hypothetical protein